MRQRHSFAAELGRRDVWRASALDIAADGALAASRGKVDPRHATCATRVGLPTTTDARGRP